MLVHVVGLYTGGGLIFGGAYSLRFTVCVRWGPKEICGFPISSCKNLGRVGRF